MIYEDHLLLTYIHDTTSGYESLQLALLIQNWELSECTLRDYFTNIINIIIYVELTQLILRCHKMLHRNTLIDQSRYIECGVWMITIPCDSALRTNTSDTTAFWHTMIQLTLISIAQECDS